MRLARRWGADEEHARRAAILHDCTKYLELDDQLRLCRQYGVELDPRQLAVRSEAFAVRSGGRSAWVAKQFIELCKAGVFS